LKSVWAKENFGLLITAKQKKNKIRSKILYGGSGGSVLADLDRFDCRGT
jgi:hypothetical protein